MPDSVTRPSDRPRLYFLDGLRGFGALIVVITHLFYQDNPINSPVSDIVGSFGLLNGHFAVWIFFIVSGFSLSVGFLRTGNRQALAALSVGRYFRLVVPILAFSLITWIAIELRIVPKVADRWDSWRDWLAMHPSFGQVLRFSLFDVFFRYNEAKSINPPVWTMSWELAGSMLVLSTLAVIGDQRRRTIVHGVLILIAIVIVPYISAFFVGLMAADLYFNGAFPKLQHILSRLAPLLALIAICLLTAFPDEAQHLMYFAASTIFFTGCLFSKRIKSFLESKAARFLGRISFPLYLVHTLVEWTFTIRVMKWAGGAAQNDQVQRLFINLLSIGVSLLVAYALVGFDAAGIGLSRRIGRAFVSSPKPAPHR